MFIILFFIWYYPHKIKFKIFMLDNEFDSLVSIIFCIMINDVWIMIESECIKYSYILLLLLRKFWSHWNKKIKFQFKENIHK